MIVRVTRFLFFVLAFSFVSACSKDTRQEKTFEELSDSDVLAQVGDHCLTKKEVTQKLRLAYDNALKAEGGSPNGAMRIVQREQARMIDRFVDRRLFSDLAKSQNLVSADELQRTVESNLTQLASARKMTVSDFERNKPSEYRYVREAFEEDVLIRAYIATNIEPKVVVSDETVTGYLDAIKAENKSVAETNAVICAKLLGIADVCRKTPSLWAKVTVGVGEEDGSASEFSYDDFMEKQTADAVFGAKDGEVVGPLTETEGYRLVMVLSSTLGEDGSATGGVRVCRQVFCRKEPEFFTWDFETTRKELRNQLSQKRIAEELEAMRTNGTAVIRYPYGKDILQRPRKTEKKAQK